jgi:hypothetical protein
MGGGNLPKRSFFRTGFNAPGKKAAFVSAVSCNRPGSIVAAKINQIQIFKTSLLYP